MKYSGQSKEDKRRIAGILAGDRKSLLSFYHAYTPALTSFIRSRVSKREDAEELLQDTLFAFLEALRDFNGDSSLKTFLYSICRHKIIDYYRRKKLKHIVFSQLPTLSILVSPLLTPEDKLDAVLLAEKIERTLNHMLPRYKTILVLKYVEGLSVENIAQRLSLSFKSAESRLFRARKAFIHAYATI